MVELQLIITSIQGAIFPFFNLPTWKYELQHASELQFLYNRGKLDTND